MNQTGNLISKIMTARICPYCMGEPEFHLDSSFLYGKNYGPIFRCHGCDAHVGCHPGTSNPLGRLADRRLRDMKKEVHNKWFDPLWKTGKMTRKEAYLLLQKITNWPHKYTHIGMMSFHTLKHVRKIIQSGKWEGYYRELTAERAEKMQKSMQ